MLKQFLTNQDIEDANYLTHKHIHPRYERHAIVDFTSKVNSTYSFYKLWNNKIVGYILTTPYVFGQVFPPNTEYEFSDKDNCLYIHDLFVEEIMRDHGFAKELLNKVLYQNDTGKKKPLAVTAINSSEGFFRKFGFKTAFQVPIGENVGCYMIRF